MRRAAALLLAIACLASCASSAPPPRWTDTYESRLELLALLQTLDAELLTSTSATATLERWCREHDLAAQPMMTVQRVDGARKEPSAEQLQRLRVADASAVKYRRVRLRCGAHTLSIADNWYVPSRLTPAMNQLLDTSDVPFGKVVRELKPYRRTIDAHLLWRPLDAGWELRPRPHGTRATLAIPDDVMVHTAVLYTSGDQPFSEVVETYRGELFAFGHR